AASAGPCPGTGQYDNTATVSTTNDSGGSASASTCVLPASVTVTKTADNATVNAGEQIGFTVQLHNGGAGTATGLAFTDDLPLGAAVSWSLVGTPAGWSITGVAPAQQHLVYTPTTLAGHTDTPALHDARPTTAASAGPCPGTGQYDNTATV